MPPDQRNFNTISPSAAGLLLLKAHTDIPFAKEAARLLESRDPLTKITDEAALRYFIVRLIHFENRYKTVDNALAVAGMKHILEISSGFSFRGLQMSSDPEVYYMDTDLPDIIALKKSMVNRLLEDHPQQVKGTLKMQALNALDEDAFLEITGRFPPGPLAIVNEGLLMYLDEAEKRRLCTIIRKVLLAKGGCWITGDIYVRSDELNISRLFPDTPVSRFLREHRVEENKFEHFDTAKAFFEDYGFTLQQKIPGTYNQLSSWKLLEGLLPVNPENTARLPRIRETWILRPAGKD